MRPPAEVGASLGVKIAQLGTKVREESLARTTPALVKLVAQVADAEGRKRADALTSRLTSWLESHASVSPLPPPVANLLAGVGGAVGFLGQYVIGNAIGFGVGMALSSTLEPWFNDLTQAAWRLNPSQLRSPAELALAVLKGNMTHADAQAEAASWGLEPFRFQTIVDNTGEPLGPAELLSLWRRGLIDDARLERGVRQSRVRNEWLDALKLLAEQPMTADEALTGFLQHQITEDRAKEYYRAGGGRTEEFDDRFNIRGQAPTPTQALELLNRGIIPEAGEGADVVSYAQVFFEGPWKDKYREAFLALREYVVPPRSVVPMVRSGAWDAERGVAELERSGVPEDTARAMLDEASSGKLAPERDLVKSEVLGAYRDGLMRAEEAAGLLSSLGYGPEEADLILALEDHRWERSFRDTAVRRIRSLYVGRKITEEEASSALAGLGAGGKATSKFLAVWDVEREVPTAELTLAQLQAALRRGLLVEAEFRDRLAGKGYSPDEVEILVGITAPA